MARNKNIVQVTQKHINKAKRLLNKRLRGTYLHYRLDCDCPIGIALTEHFGASCSAAPESLLIRGTLRHFKATRSTVRFMQKFDRGETVKPFAFRLVEEK